ncbi:DUF429 domain-containing protein [Vulcanisaeta sp. JCM 16161]|uniref:DUF429 domain-containing protein n=1 Tax=Vulcanisaeta sp. JCM 16161 TaxID=1295372 RepID=UPI001FB3CD14|nr:DUF429 domain-containing protein [Vulcanisaeta sp. JCM 16161]
MRGIYVGIDLALPNRKRTGLGLINANERTYVVSTLSTKEEIIDVILRQSPSLICIDAPLGLPKRGINRLVEIKARKLGLKLIPPLLGPMRQLTMYGMQIANELRQHGFSVLEVHPTSTLKILGMDRQDFVKFITSRLRGPLIGNEHEVDALVSAFTCLLHDNGCTEELTGLEDEGSLIIPRSDCITRVVSHEFI